MMTKYHLFARCASGTDNPLFRFYLFVTGLAFPALNNSPPGGSLRFSEAGYFSSLANIQMWTKQVFGMSSICSETTMMNQKGDYRMKILLFLVSFLVFAFCCPLTVSAETPQIPAGAMPNLPPDNMNWYDKYEAAIQEVHAEEKQVTLPSGRIINYGEVKNDKPALLLIHGQMSIWQDYALVLPALSENWHIYAVDVYGHGKSAHEESLYYLDVNGDDLIWFIDHVIGEPAVVAGHSNGAITAAYIAAQT